VRSDAGKRKRTLSKRGEGKAREKKEGGSRKFEEPEANNLETGSLTCFKGGKGEPRGGARSKLSEQEMNDSISNRYQPNAHVTRKKRGARQGLMGNEGKGE